MRLPPVAGLAQTGSRWRSARATAASQPPLASMSGPATRTGLEAASSLSARARTASGSATARPVTWRAIASAASPSSTSAYQSSIGIETKTGPRGGRPARWAPWASARGTSSARAGSKDHLTSGCGMRVASRLVRLACRVICARVCWPAVTRTGEWLACALKIAPIALPTPGAVCRLATEARPEACA